MEKAIVVRRTARTHKGQQGAFVLHLFTPEPQSKKDRLEARKEADSLSLRYPKREVHTHGVLQLDINDVIIRISEALREAMPSADPEHRQPSVELVLEKLHLAQWELFDAIQVAEKQLRAQGIDIKRLPFSQDSPPPSFEEVGF
jgi:hypothetical protein